MFLIPSNQNSSHNAFEVFEHLVNPIEEVKNYLNYLIIMFDIIGNHNKKYLNWCIRAWNVQACCRILS